MKKILSIYLFITSVSGGYYTAYILFDAWYAPLIALFITSILFHVYYIMWTKEANSATVAGDILEERHAKIPVIGKKPISMDEYRKLMYDLPDMPWHKPVTFDMAKAYYEPQKPL